MIVSTADALNSLDAASLRRAELSEDDADKRPSVQVGDPFTGKKLIEVSLELVESGLVESLQDCGAAGLASSLAEMARDGAGVGAATARPAKKGAFMRPAPWLARLTRTPIDGRTLCCS